VTARIIDGKAVARGVEQEVAAELRLLPWRPGLVAVRVGDDPASEIYVRNKAKKAEELGFGGGQRVFPETLSEADLLAEVGRLNRDDSVDGILVQLPLPKHIDAQKVLDAIDPAIYFKDIWPNVLQFRGDHPPAARSVVAQLSKEYASEQARAAELAAAAQPPPVRARNMLMKLNYEQRWRSRALNPAARRLLA